jgi:aryl-alcohol dehydrogenase-like predicted oxidoreductase
MTWGRDTDTHEAADQARTYMEAGGNLLDTAASYGDGDSERVIGGLIGTLFERDEIIISTKAGISSREGVRTVDCSRSALIAQLDKSLSRLGTDHVDLWQLQTWDSNVSIEDSLSALD